MVVEKQNEDENKVSYIVKIDSNNFILNIYIKNKYNAEKDFSKSKINEVKKYKYGDYLTVNGKVVVPKLLGNIGEFNYKRYLNSNDICGLINAYEVEYVDNVGNKFMKFIYSFKQKLAKVIDVNLSDKEAELLKSMLYGDTRNLDEEIKANFNEIGMSHVTAVSGSNLHILLLILSFIFYNIKNKRKIYILIQISIIICFCALASFELSVVRAAIMNIVTIICKYKNIKLSTNGILLITLYIMTCVNPFRIFNIGMIFSFLAILGLSNFLNIIYNFLESKIKWNIKNKAAVKILCAISTVLSITLSVNIFVLPVSIYSFNKFSFIFILSNLLVSTVCSLINILGIVSILISKIPLVSTVSFGILRLLLKSVIWISDILNNINISFHVKDFPIIIIVLYYIYILILIIKLQYNKKYINCRLNKIKKLVTFFFVLSILILFTHNMFFNNYIYFFNVGQGEMAIIKKYDTCIMVDTGSITNDTSYIFESYINKEKIDKIDALIISHFHSDHVNGIAKIAKVCKIDYLIYAYPYDLNTEEYTNLIKALDKENIKHILVKAGDNICISGIDINVLAPNLKYLSVSNNIDENENANSLCINISINNKNYLFMGDCLKESEQYIVEELKKQNIAEIELVKIGHHGSKTSTSEKFIQYILPKYAVISAKKTVYNHPNKETINKLNKYNVVTYITEKVGGIKYNI